MNPSVASSMQVTHQLSDAKLANANKALAHTVQQGNSQKIKEVSRELEAVFLTQILSEMFQGISTEAPFGGGHAEENWRGFLLDEYAKSIAENGGIGIADEVQRQLLQFQEKNHA